MRVPDSPTGLSFFHAAFSSGSSKNNPLSVLIVVGGLFAIILVIAVVVALVNKAKEDHLRRIGIWIQAMVQDVQYQTKKVVTGNGSSQTWHTHEYYVLIATW